MGPLAKGYACLINNSEVINLIRTQMKFSNYTARLSVCLGKSSRCLFDHVHNFAVIRQWRRVESLA